MENFNQQVSYINMLYDSENSLLPAIEESIAKYDLPIHIGKYDGLLLKFLVSLIKPKRIVELGTHYGYSTITMAEHLDDDSRIYTIEYDEMRFNKAQKNFAVYNSDRIISIYGKAEDELVKLNGIFDMIFIDANKRSYNKYLDWAEVNIKKGGIIIADDVFLSGAVYNSQISNRIKESSKLLMQKFNMRLANSLKYQSVTFANRSGLTAAIKLF